MPRPTLTGTRTLAGGGTIDLEKSALMSANPTRVISEQTIDVHHHLSLEVVSISRQSDFMIMVEEGRGEKVAPPSEKALLTSVFQRDRQDPSNRNHTDAV